MTAAFAQLPSPWDFIATHSIAGAIAFALITFMHVVFGELFPKSLALQAPDRVALWVARPLWVFATITRPVTAILTGAGRGLLRLFGMRTPSESLVHSVEELDLLIEDTEEAGILHPEQANIVRKVF